MSNETDHEDDGSTTVKALRERGDKAAQQAKEAEARVAALEAKIRGLTAGPIMKARGVPEGVAQLLPSDVEPTAEAVNKWLDGIGFPAQKAPEAPAPQGEAAPQEQPGRPSLDQGTAAQLATMQRVEAGGQSEALVGFEKVIKEMEALKARKDLTFEDIAQMAYAGQLPH
jgi:hypothetical protein